jgi:protein AroM
MSSKIGAVTIGQTPRDDIVPELEAHLGGRFEIEQVGVLDGLDREGLDAQRRRWSRNQIVTRLRGGEEVRVRRDFAEERLRQLADNLDDRVALILVLCTGDLPQVRTKVPILYPGRLLRSVATSLRVDRLGVLTPAASQVRAQRRRWRDVARRVSVVEASPYGPSAAWASALERLRRRRPEIVVMDCIGYTKAMRRAVGEHLDVPVLSALSLLGRVAAEVLDASQTHPSEAVSIP